MTKLTLSDLKVDFLRILQTQSVTLKTEAMMAEIMRQIKKIPDLTWYNDTYGNLYVTKGKLSKNEYYPIFVSHTDTVHKIRETYTVCRTKKGYIYAYTEDNDEWSLAGIGGDDKVGIILCIELLHRLKKVKVAFFLDEESGCKGSSVGDLSFFDDGRYAIQIDRRNGGDIITKGSGTELCSKEFEECLDTIGKNYGYEHTTGLSTDVVKLKDRGLEISTVNLSCGYYNPHHKDEYIVESEMLNCLDFCIAISHIKTRYPHKIKPWAPPANKSRFSSDFDRDWRNKRNENWNKQVIAPRHCRSCEAKLTSSESLVCRICVHKAADALIVVKDKDTGEMYVTAGAYPLLPPEYEDQIPSKACLVCCGVNKTLIEQDRGYCGDCLYCGKCGLPLVMPEEIILAEHQRCDDEEAKEPSLFSDPNACSECNITLFDDVETMERICRECKSKFSLGER